MKGLGELKVWQLAVLAYGLLYFVLVGLMEADNIARDYPVMYVACSMISQVLVVIGIVIFATDTASPFARLWKWLFPMMLAEVGVGLFFDVTLATPDSPADRTWIFSVLVSLWIMAPAYYFNFRVARTR